MPPPEPKASPFSFRPRSTTVQSPMPRTSFRRVGAALASLGLVFICGTAFVAWLSLPPERATLRIKSLSAPVHVTLDAHGIPRIAAANEADAATALGYLHARDRLFQMDLMRRAASGRLSELAGRVALPLDRLARTLGEAEHAARAYSALPDDAKTLLTAYAAGVNAWIAQRGRFSALEFIALGAPEPWRPEDSLLWNETVSMWLSDNYRTELQRLDLAGKLPPARILALWPPQPNTAPPDSSMLVTQHANLQNLLNAIPAFPAPFTLPNEASNAWAVGATRSVTGAPLLAGDPHLALQFPSLWYLARIETPQTTLVGATGPGTPFFILGHNRHIAWTFTSAGVDTQDVFIETALPGGLYATPDGPRHFDTHVEHIHVSGAPDELLTVRRTRHGPVISDLGSLKDGPVLALEAAQFEVNSGVAGILALNRANSVAEAQAAAPLIEAPVQNLTVADGKTIALLTTGKVPIRRSGDGTSPVQGADDAHDWTGYAAGNSLPQFVGPQSGVVENANERTAPPDFPVFLGHDWHAPWRARRIHELLDARPKHSLDDFEAMQRDPVSVFARDVLPAFARLPRQQGAVGKAQSLLSNWDGTMADDLPQPLIFNAAIARFYEQVLQANHVPEADGGPLAGFSAWLLSSDGATWCDGDCIPILGRALTRAVNDLSQHDGTDPAAWRWGRAHQAVFSHPLLGNLPVISFLAQRRVTVPGDDSTLFRGGSGALGDTASRHGAAYRGIYDLADLDRSRFVVTPGQSGNILSPRAWDMLKLWAAGTTIPIGPSPDTLTGQIDINP
jgi:penicillin amidase